MVFGMYRRPQTGIYTYISIYIYIHSYNTLTHIYECILSKLYNSMKHFYNTSYMIPCLKYMYHNLRTHEIIYEVFHAVIPFTQYIFIYVCVDIYDCTYIFIYIFVCVYIYIVMLLSIKSLNATCIYICTYIYMYVHTYT
jgi:hypothetical protein